MGAPAFQVDEELQGSRFVVAPRGEVDLATADQLQAAIGRATGSEASEVWIDLSDVSFMDSTGLTALLIGHRAIGANGSRRFTVICPDGPVRRALEISGLGEVLHLSRDRDRDRDRGSANGG